MHWPDTGLPFVPASPAMPDYLTALVYPGACLFEGTNLSEGRGTDAPFRTIGAPWVDGPAVTARFNGLGLPGVRAGETTFSPAGRKFVGESCHGVRLEVTEPRAYRPVAAALHLLAIVLELHRDRFRWSPYPTAANESGGGHFDRLAGTETVRELLAAGHSDWTGLVAGWTAAAGWMRHATAGLLYV
jgi:uncharacterized protein YbbC (DUF1343 family)